MLSVPGLLGVLAMTVVVTVAVEIPADAVPVRHDHVAVAVVAVIIVPAVAAPARQARNRKRHGRQECSMESHELLLSDGVGPAGHDPRLTHRRSKAEAIAPARTFGNASFVRPPPFAASPAMRADMAKVIVERPRLAGA